MRLILSVIILWFAGCDYPAEQASHAREGTNVIKKSFSFDLEEIPFAEIIAFDTIEIKNDPARKKTARYLAYPFLPVLRMWIREYQLDTTQAQIEWVCKDGYTPTNSITEVLGAGGGYLAFQDVDAPMGQRWPEQLTGRYAPYYLVWPNAPPGDYTLAWPYGLSYIKLLPSDPYLSLKPPSKTNLEMGFTAFKKHCQKCHPLNGIGGTLGPEFNRPKNITEYWSRENIIAYAKSPQSFRENSKMYAIKGLSNYEFIAVVDYLEWLAEK